MEFFFLLISISHWSMCLDSGNSISSHWRMRDDLWWGVSLAMRVNIHDLESVCHGGQSVSGNMQS